MIQKTVLSVTVIVLTLGTVRAKDCHMKSACKCQFDDGGVIDITSLGNKDNTPKFKDVKAEEEGNFYSYNPCFPFTEGKCTAAASCILNPDLSQQVQIGDAAKAGFKYDPGTGHVIAAYSSGSITDLKISEVMLVCDSGAKEPVFTANGQQKGGQFEMTLKHVCACPDGCSSTGPTNKSGSGGGISGGSVMLIIFFSVLIVYFIAGTVILKFVKKKEGTEIVPNKSIWIAIPGLIKSGFQFTFGKCFARFRTTNYAEI